MGIEIERKFLVASDAWRVDAFNPRPMVQGYLGGKQCAVRVRTSADSAWLTLKSAGDSVTRLEFEYPVPLADAQQMLEAFAIGPMVVKTRYHVAAGPLTWEIDVFEGENAGLLVAEIELPHAEARFTQPAWLGREVSGDPRFLNVNLARRPWASWSEAERAAC